MPSIGGYHPYGLGSILTGLECNRACVGYAGPTNCSARQPPPTYLPELRRALLDEWCNIPQNQIDNLILIMPRPRRCERTIPYLWRACKQLRHFVGCVIVRDGLRIASFVLDGLVAFAMDRWHHDCGARRVRIISRPGSPMSERRFDLSTFRSERTNEASTLTITPKRSSSRDVGTSSYRYHTATIDS
ncbi:uncharacterized protein TNCV_1778151 [Trichonephila clavipes]|nr:uncharacterized protein TNCV_1778151 [Trichonephila clavipes]